MKLVAICIAVCMLLTGCMYTQSGVDTLLSPPKLSELEQNIYTALESSVGKNIKLKYPRKGENKSAFMIANIDTEDTVEAIVFYELSNSAAPSMPLRINVLDQRNGIWTSVYDVGVEASEVEKLSTIMVEDKCLLAVGFNLISKQEKLLNLYSFSDGILSEKYSSRCMNFEIIDIDDDSLSEIITITRKESNEQTFSTANLLKLTKSGAYIESQIAMEPLVSEYININKGSLISGAKALYVDGIKGANNIVTEILTYHNKNLHNLIYNADKTLNMIEETARPAGSLSVDINKDGVIDIPQVYPARGYSIAEKHQQLYLTDWYNYIDGKLQLIETTYIDYSLGFAYSIPDKYKDKITVTFNSQDNELIFLLYKGGKLENSKKLFSIKASLLKNYETEAKNYSYVMLQSNGQLVYLYKLYNEDSEFNIEVDEIINNFSIIY